LGKILLGSVNSAVKPIADNALEVLIANDKSHSDSLIERSSQYGMDVLNGSLRQTGVEFC
jgi:hypothetical protein